ncbi:MAG: DUF262 domain-containing HNH endonuclease family protein [Planctomycetota bacterium]
MTATNFRTENNTLRKLLGNGLTYRVPQFQRDYSWAEEEWEDLWQDLLGTLRDEGEPAHYMGYLVLQSSDDRVFDVIDGQQRLTTVSVLVLAVLKGLQRLVDSGVDAASNRQRSDQIRGTYLGYLDPVTLVARPKLTLNRNNNGYWQNHLVSLGNLPQRGFRASEQLLRSAFLWFDERVGKFVEAESDRGKALASFLEKVSDHLFFTVITVTDELNAYKVFETLNARGVRLSATDLLKNWLFSLLARDGASKEDVSALEDRWEAMVGRLGAEDFPDFLRVHWNSRREFTRQAVLFKTIRSRVVDRGAVFALLRDMEEDLDHYLALAEPEGSNWPEPARQHARTLKLFKVERPYSMLIAARRRFDDAVFEAVLRDCVVIAFRASVICGFSAGEQERVFSDVALGIAAGKIDSRKAVLERLRAVYPADKTFRAAFTEKVIRTTPARNARVVRYLLCKIERHVGGRSELAIESESFNIEHVLPQNPGPEWGHLTEAEAEGLVYRLGNMTLAKTGENSAIGNAGWVKKRPVLQSSEFEITRRLAQENETWDATRISSRQAWLATQAMAIWRIDLP